MRQGSINIGIIICVVAIFIYIVKNQEIILKIVEKLRKKKLEKFFLGVFIFFIALSIVWFINFGFDVREKYINKKEKDEMFFLSDKKIEEEEKYYLELMNKKFENQNYDKPYIFEGFSYVEGKYNNGFVIEDEKGNQYVWVPCTNEDIDDIVKLQRKNFSMPSFISKETCYNENYKAFLNSALENGGFYISRYEIGKEDGKPVSKKGIEIWSDITKDEAKNVIKTMYDDNNLNCELINGYAYDTTLEWIKNINDLKYDVVDISKKEKIYSGRNEYNKINDFVDNVLELSTEILYDNVVIRGFSSSDEEINGVKFCDESRYTIFEDSKMVSLVDTLAFRIILYK